MAFTSMWVTKGLISSLRKPVRRFTTPPGRSLVANTAGTILATSFLAWEADQDPDALVQLVDRGFSLVATTFE
jgi:hypothetical protein